MRMRLLRILLAFAGLVWGVSIFGIFLSWPAAAVVLEGLGAQPIAHDRMLDYWLRMAAGAFTLIGCWYFALAIWPLKFCAAIPWFGTFMLVEGIILFAHGLRLGLPLLPFYADCSACLFLGGAILVLSKHARADSFSSAKAPAAAA